MCIVSSPPKAAEAPPLAPKPPTPELLDQAQAGVPQETAQDQLLASQQGLNQLRILPGISFTGK